MCAMPVPIYFQLHTIGGKKPAAEMTAVGEAFVENFSSRVFDPGIMNSQ
jgi:hypothetical protein